MTGMLESRDRPADTRTSVARGPMALLLVVVAYGLMLWWISLHPYGTGWDEAHYVNQAWEDRTAFERGGGKGLASSLLFRGRSAPPGHRLLALPVSLAWGPSARVLRCWWIVVFGLTLFFLYQSGVLLSGTEAGWLTVSLAVLTPGILSWAMRYQTEGPLFLGITATLYFLLRWFRTRESAPWEALALGVSTGAGLLSKLTFVLLLAPVILVMVVAGWSDIRPRLRSLALSGAVAVVMVGPFYALSLPRYFAYASQSWKRTEIPGFWTKLAHWLETFAGFNMGPLLLVVVVALAVTLAFKWKRLALDRTTGIALAALGCGVLPLLVLHLRGTNAFQRLTAPALVLILPAVATLASRIGFTRGRVGILVALLGLAQATALALPLAVPSARYETTRPAFRGVLTVYRPAEQWDWEPLRRLVLAHRPPPHEIIYAGLGESYNSPQIHYPWARRGEAVRVRPLPSLIAGDFDTNQLSERLGSATAVLTLPSLERWAPIFYPEIVREAFDDNRYNRGIQSFLEDDPRFAGPVEVRPGGPDAAPVLVYLRVPSAAPSTPR